MKDFDIYFFGQLLPGTDPAMARSGLMNKFGITEDKIDIYFSGKAVLLKSHVDVDKASKYREVFRQFGAIVDIVPSGQKPNEPKLKATAETSKKPAQMRLLPLGAYQVSASQADSPSDTPDISGLSLAAVSPLPQQEGAIPLHIDTSGLSLSVAETGSLEDCAAPVTPLPLPDLGGISLADAGADLSAPTSKTVDTPLPDISSIQVTPARTGSLEDCRVAKKATPIPDISGMRLAE